MTNRRFMASFPAGFERVVGSLLLRDIPDASDLEALGGLLLFSSGASAQALTRLPLFNNVFLILREWPTSERGFADLAAQACQKSELRASREFWGAVPRGSFRLRFSRANQFESVDKKTMERVESAIARETGLRPDRFEPGMEFWFSIRREGRSFFAARLLKTDEAEAEPRAGELRPSFARLLVALALAPVVTPSADLESARAAIVPSSTASSISEPPTLAAGQSRGPASDGAVGEKAERAVFLDPFAGYGSIPVCLAETVPGSLVYASDADPERARDLARRFAGHRRVRVSSSDATSLNHLAAASVDAIVTDPPWGDWEGGRYRDSGALGELYSRALAEFSRVLKPGAVACVLTGAKAEFERSVSASAHFASSSALPDFRTDVLVNGKKSAVYRLIRDQAPN
jgi:predicted RNA methylase